MESDGRMKRLVLLFLAITILGFWFFSQKMGPNISLEMPGFLALTTPTTPTPKAPLDTPPNETSPPPATEAQPAAEFQQWAANESAEVENTTTNSREKELELKTRARNLTPVEVHYLAMQSLLGTNPARQRIFTTYLLTLAPEVTQTGLQEILQAPLEYPGQHPVHSPEETLATQERSLRRMALDALLEKAKTSPETRDELRKFISQITDESLRNYAERSLEAIK